MADAEFIRRPSGDPLGIGQEGPYNMSFWKHCYHIVWATKRREPLILPAIEARLYAYIAHKAGELGVFLYAMGGTEDHMHIVPAIPP